MLSEPLKHLVTMRQHGDRPGGRDAPRLLVELELCPEDGPVAQFEDQLTTRVRPVLARFPDVDVAIRLGVVGEAAGTGGHRGLHGVMHAVQPTRDGAGHARVSVRKDGEALVPAETELHRDRPAGSGDIEVRRIRDRRKEPPEI